MYTWTDKFGSLTHDDIAVISSAETIYLQGEDTVHLKILKVDGTLVFDKCDESKLNAYCILVTGTGRIQAGTSQEPMITGGSAEINLVVDDGESTPTPLTPPSDIELGGLGISDQETKDALKERGLVVVNGGTLSLFGEPRIESWVRLNANATANSSSLTLDSSPDWRAGDEVLIVSTDFSQDQAEVKTLQTAVSGGSTTLTSALAYDHHGVKENFDPLGGSDIAWEIDERGEVALLTRNVVVSGQLVDYGTYIDCGHVMFHNENLQPTPIFQIAWTDFNGLGVEGHKGRYPVHLHQLRDISSDNSYVRYCTIRNSKNRGVVIHDTKGAEIKGNVIYNILGRGVYFEEYYKENGNPADQACEIRDNLVAVLERSFYNEPGFDPDDDVAGIYINNPRNLFAGNVIAGSRQHGIWINVAHDDSNWSWLSTGNHGFRNNTIHSCGKRGITQDSEANPTLQKIVGAKVYKCREQGMWLRTKGKLEIFGNPNSNVGRSWVADCRAGIYPATNGIRGYGPAEVKITNLLFVGESSNLGTPDPGKGWETTRSLAQDEDDFVDHDMRWDVLTGVESYDGLNIVDNCRFAEFHDVTLPTSHGERFSGCFTQAPQYADWSVDPRNSLSNLTFHNVDRELYFRDSSFGGATPIPFTQANNQIANNVLIDLDDSLGYGQGGEVYIMPYTNFLVELDDQPPVLDATLNSTLNAYVLENSDTVNYGQVTVKVNDATVSGGVQPDYLKVWRDFSDGSGTTMAQNHFYCKTINDEVQIRNEFPFNAPEQGKNSSGVLVGPKCYYTLSWFKDSGGTPTAISSSEWPKDIDVNYRFSEDVGHVVYLEIERESVPQNIFIGSLTGTIVPMVNLSSLLNTTEDHAWTHIGSGSTGRLVVKLTSRFLDGQPLNEGTEVKVLVR